MSSSDSADSRRCLGSDTEGHEPFKLSSPRNLHTFNAGFKSKGIKRRLLTDRTALNLRNRRRRKKRLTLRCGRHERRGQNTTAVSGQFLLCQINILADQPLRTDQFNGNCVFWGDNYLATSCGGIDNAVSCGGIDNADGLQSSARLLVVGSSCTCALDFLVVTPKTKDELLTHRLQGCGAGGYFDNAEVVVDTVGQVSVSAHHFYRC